MTEIKDTEYLDSVAAEICKLIGSPARLYAMIGAKDFFKGYIGTNHDLPGAMFKFQMCKQYNYFSIALNKTDLYQLRFVKIHNFNIIREKTFDNIYFDRVTSLFTEVTGLALKL